ncbi:MAG TPA: MFS transporter [Vicinamibacterales bacterium]|nr:MFS transporter [Vicinamibacterales bacterium]
MNPYRALITENRNYRLLWFGQIVSQLGDWFNSVALYALLLELTGTATSVALMIIVQFLPMAVIGPVAGVVVDRVNRRRLMIATDVVRGLAVLVLLLVRRPDQVWIIYLVMGAVVSMTAFFEPARTAVIPNLTTRSQLLTANALSSATWSAMLAIGAGLGGVVTALFGRNVAFLVNAVSFLASAVIIARTSFDAAPPAVKRPAGWASLTGFGDLVEGIRYVKSDRHVAALMLVKAGWGIAGGVLLIMTVMGEREFRMGGSAAAGIGVLYAARGIGAGIGPIMARAWLGQQPDEMRRAIAPSYVLVALFYLMLSWAPNIYVAGAAVIGAHAAGSVLWVFSTVLLQMSVPDRFRGRVFSAELALLMIISAASSFACGYALDNWGASPFLLTRVLGALFVLPTLGWLLIERRHFGRR